MFNRGSIYQRRNANNSTPPPYNRGPSKLRRSATQRTPPPYFGATTSSQKCQLLIAPMGRVTKTMQQCRFAVTLPNHSTGGHWVFAAMPCNPRPHLTTGSHPNDAAMLFMNRSRFIWCRSARAEMPQHWRTNNQRPARLRRNATTPSPRTKQGDPLWINATKTQPLPRYI